MSMKCTSMPKGCESMLATIEADTPPDLHAKMGSFLNDLFAKIKAKFGSLPWGTLFAFVLAHFSEIIAMVTSGTLDWAAILKLFDEWMHPVTPPAPVVFA